MSVAVNFRQTRFYTGMPKAWIVDNGNELSLDETYNWIAGKASSINEVLNQEGCLLLRGLTSVREAEHFSGVMHCITPDLRDYLGGTSPRTRVFGKIMTATYTPPTWSIILHQEMAYTLNLPDRISFFCKRPAHDGGVSTLGDMREALRRISPAVRNKLERYGVQLRRTIPSPESTHLKPGVKKPWPEVFETDDRQEVDRIVSAKGWRAEWIHGDTLQLWQDTVPAVRTHPVTGHDVWCNQAHFFSPVCMMTWAEEDGREDDYKELAHARQHNPEMLDMVFLGSGEPVSDEDALHVYRILKAVEQRVHLLASDVLLLDNLLYSHGRTAFSDDRTVLVALADRPSPVLIH